MEVASDDTLSIVAGYLGAASTAILYDALGRAFWVSVRTFDACDLPDSVDTIGVSRLVSKYARVIRMHRVNLASRALATWNSPALNAVAQIEPPVTALSVAGLSLGTLGRSKLEGMLSLRELDVTSCTTPLSHQGPIPPAFADTLLVLRAVNTTLVPQRWPLQRFGNLCEFEGLFREPGYISDLAHCSRLKSLHLHSTRLCTLRIYRAAWRRVCASLESLSLTNCDAAPRPHLLQGPYAVLAEALGLAAHRLTRLVLRDVVPPLCDAMLTVMLEEFPWKVTTAPHTSRFTGLRHLELAPCTTISDIGVAEIVRAAGATLDTLMLGPELPAVTDFGVAAISDGCPVLSVLCLPFAPMVGNKGIAALARGTAAPTLKRLSITRAGITSAAALNALATACISLVELRLWGCHEAVEDDGVRLTGDGESVDRLDLRCPVSGREALDLIRSRGCRVLYATHPRSLLASQPRVNDAVTHRASSGTNSATIPCALGCGACAIAVDDVLDHAEVCASGHRACPLAVDGCAFTGTSREIGNHIAVCPTWVVTCRCGCGSLVGRMALNAHLAEQRRHERASSAAMTAVLSAMRVGTAPRCPLVEDGCEWPAQLMDGRDTSEMHVHAALMRVDGDDGAKVAACFSADVHDVGAHLGKGHCNAARYICIGCGADAGSLRRGSCESDTCRAISLTRCRLALPPSPPPAVLLRGLSSQLLEAHGVAIADVKVGASENIGQVGPNQISLADDIDVCSQGEGHHYMVATPESRTSDALPTSGGGTAPLADALVGRPQNGRTTAKAPSPDFRASAEARAVAMLHPATSLRGGTITRVNPMHKNGQSEFRRGTSGDRNPPYYHTVR